MRTFATGATRDVDTTKLDYEGFLSPLVLRRYAEYLHKHRIQANGDLRASDNWQKGIPRPVYMKSAWRHFMEWWWLHRVGTSGHQADAPIYDDDIQEAICAVIFNACGYLHETLREKNSA